MKSVVLKSALPLVLLAVAPLARSAEDTPPLPVRSAFDGKPAVSVEAEKAWQALVEKSKQPNPADKTGAGTGPTTRSEAVVRSRARADQARNFYAAYPHHPQAAEARKLEVLSLIDLQENEDTRESLRLDQRVASLRSDVTAPVAARAAAVAAYEFTRTLRPLKSQAERMDSTVAVARRLAQEFPEEPQAYAAMMAVAKASPREKAEPIAQEIVSSRAPAELKAEAQTLIDRHALVGRSLAEVLGEPFAGVLATLPANAPVIVYSWATWGQGSLELGRMLQARRFAAIGVCLDEDTESASVVEHQAGLGGKHFYDPDGLRGRLVERLKFSNAGQVYLVDGEGVIRDVRGGDEFEAKLKLLGFSTPALVVPSTAELLRQ